MSTAPIAAAVEEIVASPVGPLHIGLDAAGALVLLAFADAGAAPSAEDGAPFTTVGRALARYFAGTLDALDGLAVNPAGTEFQRAVWAELRRIPVGATVSYGALAARIGRPKAVRAVGLANGANPIAVVIPCHRVIGSDGSLTGYGGGLDRKRWLLAHEARGSGLFAPR